MNGGVPSGGGAPTTGGTNAGTSGENNVSANQARTGGASGDPNGGGFFSKANDMRKGIKGAGGIGNYAKNAAMDKLGEKIKGGLAGGKNGDNKPDSVKKKQDEVKNKGEQQKNKGKNGDGKSGPIDQKKKQLNEMAFRKAASTAVDAVAPGAGQAVDPILDHTKMGQEAVDEARSADNPIAAIKKGTKKLVEGIVKREVKKKLAMYLIPVGVVMLTILIILLSITGGKHSDSMAFAGYGNANSLSANYQQFYDNVEKYGTSNKYMVIAVLTGYKEKNEYVCKEGDTDDCLDSIESSTSSKTKKYIKEVNEAISKSSNGIDEGNYDDPENSGSDFFKWLYNDFVEEYYSEWFTDNSPEAVAATKKEIISYIYKLYRELSRNSCSGTSSTGFDSACDFNLTKVDVRVCNSDTVMTTISLKDYILGVVYAEIDDHGDDENTFKAQAIIAKTFILARNGYDSSTKHIRAQSCTREQVWCDIYNGCNYYQDSGGFDATYSKAYNGLSGGSTYKTPLSSDRLSKWEAWYDEIYPYLFLDLSKHQDVITKLDYSDVVGYYDKEQDYWYRESITNHYKYDQLLRNTANAGTSSNTQYYVGKDIYDMGKYCKQLDSGASTVSGKYVYYSQSLEPWASMTHGCGSGKSFAAKGCFQTSAAMTLTNLLGREITPEDMNNYTNNNRGLSCTGTTSYYTFFLNVAKQYGVSVKMITNKQSNSAQLMLDELAKGNLITQILDCETVSDICPRAFGGHGIAIVPGTKEGYVTTMDSAYPDRKAWEVTAKEATGSNTMASFYVWSLDSGTVASNDISSDNTNLVSAGGKQSKCDYSGSSSNSGSMVKHDTSIYVGDSRTVGMKDAITPTDKETFIAEVGKGYAWFNNTVMNTLKTSLTNNQKQNVIINLGTNDLTDTYAASSYSHRYSELATSYPDTYFIILSVTPIEDSKNTAYKSVNNSMVVDFNKKLSGYVNDLKKNNVKYCNIYDKVVSGGYNTTDGIHYDNDTYKKIYQYIKEC